MAKFKSVLATPVINFSDFGDLERKIQEYADRLSEESVGGWEFVGIYPFQANQVTNYGIGGMLKNKIEGRALFDNVRESFTTYMMLFKRD